MQFFLQIGAMLAIGLLFGRLLRRVKQPAVLGELIGGIILGPTVLGLLFPSLYRFLFPGDPEVTLAREAVIQLGMLFFMFVAGLEIDLADLGRNKKSILSVSVLGCILPFGLGVVSIWLFPNFWVTSPQAVNLNFVLFIGIALSISALPVITRILMDLSLLNSKLGSIVIASATVNDLIGWALFALLLSSFSGGNLGSGLFNVLVVILLFTLFVLAAGHWVVGPLLRWVRDTMNWPSNFLTVAAIFILISAALAEWLHIHAIFGAFLMGVALYSVFDHHSDTSQAREIIHQFAVSFFAPLYFVSVGLKADFAANFDWQLALLVIALATIGKVVGAGLGALLGGLRWREALAIGFAMNARGAMEMILASVALEFQLIDQRIFVALVIMALVTSLLSSPMLNWLLKSEPASEAQGQPS